MAALEESGFVVVPGLFPVEQLAAVADAYDAGVWSASVRLSIKDAARPTTADLL
jgi:hypothetical protein